MSDAPAPAAAPAAPKGRSKLIPILAVVLLLGGGGGGGYWYFVVRPSAATVEAPAEETHEPEGTGVVKFDPFVVNLADPGGMRYLRVNLAVVVKDDLEAKEFAESAVMMTRTRSALIELLAQQVSETLVTPEGKATLKAAVKESVAHVAHEFEVSDVLFSEFVVQF